MTEEPKDDFWVVPAKAEEEREKLDELNEEFMGSMKLKAPKPVFNVPTKCRIVDAKFFKTEKTEKDSKNNEYVPFQITVTFIKDGEEIEFKETYRGGRLYTNPTGTSIYIGPASSLGRFKAVCIENGVKIGTSVKDFAAAVKGLKVTMKGETVMFSGKKFEKNFVYAIDRQ